MVKILTVGDGDLSLSLALARAYGDSIEVEATVLDSPETLLHSYPDAPIQELTTAYHIPIHYNIDATQLHNHSIIAGKKWDIILFHHPHLGLASLAENEAHHATQHFQLLCHYLYSASYVAEQVHVCLCGTQADTWRLLEAAQRHQLRLVQSIPTAVPISKLWGSNAQEQEPLQSELEAKDSTTQAKGFAAPRRYRNGKLGSRHFLGKYGYRHRRTEGVQYKGRNARDSSVAGSMHYVFEKESSSSLLPKDLTPSRDASDTTCAVCGAVFQSNEELWRHWVAPALPDVQATTTTRNVDEYTSSSDEVATTRGPLPNFSTKAVHNRETIVTEKQYHTNSKDGGEERHWKVAEIFNGKRLRWFLHHEEKNCSKRKAELYIKGGNVTVNGEVVLDSSRILSTSDKVILTIGEQHVLPSTGTDTCTKNTNIEVVYRDKLEDVLVVKKPSGMRTKGTFPGTLEHIVSTEERERYECVTRLDTSCTGLCVLTLYNKNDPQRVLLNSVTHTVTVLVHGTIPATWFPKRVVSLSIQPKWDRKRKIASDKNSSIKGAQEDKLPGFHSDSTAPIEQICEIVPMSSGISPSPEGEEHGSSSTRLSTLSIHCQVPSASDICWFLRHEGFPVVGDHHCRREYLLLKRSIRNRIKNKLSFGCYRVVLDRSNNTSDGSNDEVIVEIEIPLRLLASHWEEHISRGAMNKK